MDRKELESALEAILFASGEPVQVDRICVALDIDRPTVEQLLQKLMDYYAYERRGIRLLKIDGCLGLKTGYTKAAGRTLVSCAEKNGQRLIAVTLQDGNDWADHQALYEYGFSAYPARTCAVRGQALTQASVSGGVSPTVPLIAGAGFCYPAAETERLTTRICLDEPLRAPVSAGKTVGAAVFCLNGTEIGRVPLVAGRTMMPKVSSALAGLKLELKDE